MSTTWTSSTDLASTGGYTHTSNITTIDSSSFGHFKIIDEETEEVKNKLKEIEHELAEIALLYDLPSKKSVYEMSFEEYMDLPGNVRL